MASLLKDTHMILEDNEVLLGISKRRRSVDEKSRSEKLRSKKTIGGARPRVAKDTRVTRSHGKTPQTPRD